MKESYIAKAIIAAFFALAALVCMAQVTNCQTVKIGVSIVNTEYSAVNPIEAVEYFQGISAELNAKVYQQSKFRVGGVFNYQRDNFDFPTDTYSFGPELSYNFKFVEPFARVLVGFDTTYNSDRKFSREYQAGVRLNFGNIYIEPIKVGFKRTEGLFSPSTQKIYSGIGIQFGGEREVYPSKNPSKVLP